MSDHQWIPLALFAFVSSITPGPNNLLATASGARFGLKRTLPQVAGVTAGFTLLLLLAASGVGALIADRPALATSLAIFGYAYLVWMSATLIRAAVRRSAPVATVMALRPMRFGQAVLFQFANPKAWMMALSAASSFMDRSGSIAALAMLCAVFAVINFPCVGAWAALGAHLQRWLQSPSDPWRLRTFNASMGAALMATTVWMIARA